MNTEIPLECLIQFLLIFRIKASRKKFWKRSLSIVKVGSFDQKKLTGKSVIDIGTGAGAPSVAAHRYAGWNR